MRYTGSSATEGGFTLIELLIALMLGLLVTGIVIQVYLTNIRVQQFNQNFSLMQEDGRFLLSYLRAAIQMGGYNDPDTAFVPHPSNAVEGTDGPDSISVYYEGGTGVVDCVGTAIAPGFGVSDVFTVLGDGLVCNGSVEAVVSGIESLQIQYGLDLDGDGVPNQFVKASDVAPSPGDWSDVVSVRVAALLRSDEEVTNDPDTQVYQVLDQTFGPAGDRRIRKLFTTTIALRN